MKPPHVLVIGASGQLGSAVTRAFADCQVTPHTSASLDITDTGAVDAAVAAAHPDVIVNCAAFNDVDGAEERPLVALAVNAFAVRSLARAAERSGARLVHYSTDFVFDGTARSPYTEEDSPAPQSTYAASKLLGEWFAVDAPGGLALRVESLFGSLRHWTGRRGTIDAMVEGLEHGREVRAFTDRVVSPGYVVDIAAATRHLIETDAPGGVYHCVNSGVGTWFDVAEELARLLGVEPHLKAVTTGEVTMKAKRPVYCALSNQKIAAAGFAMPSWQDGLRRWIAVRNGQPS